MKKMDESVRFVKNVWALTKSYWQSEEKKKAYLLLLTIIALTLGVVFMLVQLNQWYNIFYSALQNYEKEKIFSELFHFSWLAFIYIILAVYAFYLQQVLIINWRRWLTNEYIDEWLNHKTYYRLQMFGTATDNPDQRISEDVRMFVEYTLRFGIGILKAFTTFASFVVILYNLSGPLQFKLAGMDIHIPGADFRFAMMRMRENAESVAFYSGEGHEGGVFKKRFSLLLNNFWSIIKKQKQLTWLNSWYSQIAIIFPLVVAMPRYLAKEITLGGLMQISSAFGRVQESLSYFVDMYSSIAEWQAVVERLTGFGLHMQQVKQENAQQDLQRKPGASDAIVATDMDVTLPDESAVLQNVSFTLETGTNVLIKGVSGSGKSTLLRALAGIWPYVKGTLEILQKVHERGYIHCDISPINSFLCRDGGVYLIDWGNAADLHGSMEDHVVRQAVNVLYSAPEQQISGRVLTPATDIYCLCATIYDAVCGEPPRQCVERLRGEPLVPPSIHASDLPVFVNEILLKGLSLDPAERPQDAAELLAIIDREVAFSVSPVAGTGNASVSARLLHEKRSPFGFLTSRRSFRPTVL